MAAPIRVRFAPSPTGFLHIGGVRAALFNYLYARNLGGQFLLRIEDTDLERSETRFTDDILASMKWLGMHWDEEPVFQSKRLPVYLQKAEELVRAGRAYRCYCTEEEIEAMRAKATAEGRKPMYDRSCRERTGHAPESKPSVIRLKVPLDGGVDFTDLVYGPIHVENKEIDDYVLIRSNGAPTYNLSVVIDDVESRMTHVIRGEDHINNTPKQIHLYNYLGYAQPHFAHLPMILGADKKKLSKRHGAVAVSAYRAEGYLPETMLNFLARLGWSHGDQEVFTLDEMIRYFGFDHVQKSGGVFNSEKLLWLNGEHIRRTTPERLARVVHEDYAEMFVDGAMVERVETALGARIIALLQPKVKLVKEIADQLVPLCKPGAVEVDASGLKWNKNPDLKPAIQAAVGTALERFTERFQKSGEHLREGIDASWGTSPNLEDRGLGHSELETMLRELCEKHTVKLGDLMQPIRLAVTGKAVSGASLFELLVILPWDVVEPRLRKILTL